MSNIKTSAIITTVGANNKVVSKAITDINPNADNGAIKTLCQSLNSLTNNTLTGVQRVDKTDITTATPSVAKAEVTLDTTRGHLDEDLPTLKIGYNYIGAGEGGVDYYIHLGEVTSSDTWIPVAFLVAAYKADGTFFDEFYYNGGSFIGYVDKDRDPYFAVKFTGNFQGRNENSLADAARIEIDFIFPETATTAETTYRLTFTHTAGEATFAKV